MDFFALIGAQRSGTTWLYHMLDDHPEIYMAKPCKPEPKHFITPDEYAKGPDYYLQKYFPTEKKIIGEKSTSYIEHPDCCNRIRDYFPQAKLIAILRDPVTRALSNYAFSRKNKLETRSLEDVFLHNAPAPPYANISVNPFDYLARGKYINYLQPFIDCIGSDNIKLVIYERLMNDLSVMDEVYEFVGCESRHSPAGYRTVVNRATERDDLNQDVTAALRSYYEEYNKQLRGFVDLSWWM